MLNKEEARRLFNIGKKYHADITHLVIADDHWDKFYITKEVFAGDSVKAAIDEIKSHGSNISILAVLNYDLPINEQLKEDIPWHDEPSKKYKSNYDKALDYATEKHNGQTRKGKIVKPYIEHPKEVSHLVEKYMKNNYKVETYKIAALLHDTLEDTNATYPEIIENFGVDVANIVQALTSDKEEQKKVGKSEYLTNKLLAMEDDTLAIKLCDRLSNVKDLSIADDMNFIEKYSQETTFILNNLLINRKLNSIHLEIINDIALELKNVAKKYDANFSICKKPIIYQLTNSNEK